MWGFVLLADLGGVLCVISSAPGVSDSWVRGTCGGRCGEFDLRPAFKVPALLFRFVGFFLSGVCTSYLGGIFDCMSLMDTCLCR